MVRSSLSPSASRPLSVRLRAAVERFWVQGDVRGRLGGRGRVVAAVSGGADSMALLYLLAGPFERPAWAPAVTAAHVNHGLRGKASDGDQVRVAALARDLGVPFRYRRLNAERLREGGRGGGLENAARMARYAALGEIARQENCSTLVLAHHQDDLAETFLMRLLRGSGLTGLAGFAPEVEMRGMTLVRPLIDWSAREVREVARLARLDWGEDATNRDTDLTRNRLRHRVLPYLDRMSGHPPVVRMLARTARRLEAEASVLRSHVAGIYAGARLERSNPRRIGLPRATLAAGNAALAPYLARALMCDIVETPYPPSAERIAELVAFALHGPRNALHQTASNVVVWISRSGEELWAYRKPERKIDRKTLLATFEAGV